MSVGFAIGIWLLFMGITNIFDQLGQKGYISPEIAVWSPVFLIAILGAYVLTKV
jgi:lipopolysaccharide export LptBFGC system permease protein LptF